MKINYNQQSKVFLLITLSLYLLFFGLNIAMLCFEEINWILGYFGNLCLVLAFLCHIYLFFVTDRAEHEE